MLKADIWKLKIIEILKENKKMSLRQLQKAVQLSHTDTLKNLLEFLEQIGFLEVIDTNDNRKTKLVKLKKSSIYPQLVETEIET